MTDRRLAVKAWESLFRAQYEVFAEISADFRPGDLEQAEYDVLLTISRAPDLTVRLRDITARMLISQPSVSRLVDRMVARGMVVKAVDPDDGRGALVTATDDGAARFRRVSTAHGRTISDRMSVLSDAELRDLYDLTMKLRGR